MPSAKKARAAARRAKTVAAGNRAKTAAQRTEEAHHIREQLQSFGLSNEMAPVAAFDQILQQYDVHGVAATGRVPLPGLKRTIEYILPLRASTPASITLKYTPTI